MVQPRQAGRQAEDGSLSLTGYDSPEQRVAIPWVRPVCFGACQGRGGGRESIGSVSHQARGTRVNPRGPESIPGNFETQTWVLPGVTAPSGG